MLRHTKRAAAALGLLLALPAALDAASQPPGLRFRTLTTGRVSVTFHQGLEDRARLVAALAAEIVARHEARYHVDVGRIRIVFADVDDDPNGFASPLPYPLVQIRAAAPDGTDDFGNYEGWLRVVLTHELAHVVHLDQAHGLVRVGRRIFGRAPFLFPNTLTPIWMIEGLATYEETEGTAFGRGRNPDSRMILRMAAVENAFPREDLAASYPDRWPQGALPYLFGEAFLRDLSVRYGPETLPALARVHAGRILPFADELTSTRVTGASFHAQWQEWTKAALVTYGDEAAGIVARGLTPSRPLTTRGVRQTGPRFSPDRATVAYTSRSVARFTQIRLIGADGTNDRKLVDRNGGDALAWTPDGRTLVYDEPQIFRTFESHSDLSAVDVATRRVRRLTRGMRASQPDVSPDGTRIAFVRRVDDRSELYTMALDGRDVRPLTTSAAETQWSAPHWSPAGDTIVAARWTPGGWLDLLLVDVATGALTRLTEDRARDMEPVFTPDGAAVLFRSDRDGVSNLYLLRLADRAILRVTNVLGGAFDADVSSDGARVVFADYSARGYDVHVMDLDPAALAPAPPFTDVFGAPRPLPTPVDGPSGPYRPLPALLPRFWSPYAGSVSDEWIYGVVTGGADPLLRHAFGLDVHGGTRTGRASVQGFYQYDRFRPTILAFAEDKSEPDAGGLLRTRQVDVRASIPIARSFRYSQSASVEWRRERAETDFGALRRRDQGGASVGWSLSTAKQYPYSISPIDGWTLRLAAEREDPSLGSDLRLAKLTGDVRGYLRLGAEQTLAVRAGGGSTIGGRSDARAFSAGGFPDGSLFDATLTNPAVLRGYHDDAFLGRSLGYANLEYRFPLAFPQRGIRSLPLFLRHLHGALFADAANVWSGAFRGADVKTAAGLALGGDLIVGHALPLTGTAGVARGFASGGTTRAYFRLGLAF